MGNFIPKNLQREIHLHEQAQVLRPVRRSIIEFGKVPIRLSPIKS